MVTTCAQCVAGSTAACDGSPVIPVLIVALGALLFGIAVLAAQAYLRH